MKQTVVRLRQSTEAAIQEFARSAYLDALESRHEPYIGASHNRTLTDSVSRTLAPPQSSLRSHAAVCAEQRLRLFTSYRFIDYVQWILDRAES